MTLFDDWLAELTRIDQPVDATVLASLEMVAEHHGIDLIGELDSMSDESCQKLEDQNVRQGSWVQFEVGDQTFTGQSVDWMRNPLDAEDPIIKVDIEGEFAVLPVSELTVVETGEEHVTPPEPFRTDGDMLDDIYIVGDRAGIGTAVGKSTASRRKKLAEEESALQSTRDTLTDVEFAEAEAEAEAEYEEKVAELKAVRDRKLVGLNRDLLAVQVLKRLLEDGLLAGGVLTPLVAGKRIWNELLHPRDSRGRFIEKWGFVSWIDDLFDGDGRPTGRKGKVRGQVRDIRQSRDGGSEVWVQRVNDRGDLVGKPEAKRPASLTAERRHKADLDLLREPDVTDRPNIRDAIREERGDIDWGSVNIVDDKTLAEEGVTDNLSQLDDIEFNDLPDPRVGDGVTWDENDDGGFDLYPNSDDPNGSEAFRIAEDPDGDGFVVYPGTSTMYPPSDEEGSWELNQGGFFEDKPLGKFASKREAVDWIVQSEGEGLGFEPDATDNLRPLGPIDVVDIKAGDSFFHNGTEYVANGDYSTANDQVSAVDMDGVEHLIKTRPGGVVDRTGRNQDLPEPDATDNLDQIPSAPYRPTMPSLQLSDETLQDLAGPDGRVDLERVQSLLQDKPYVGIDFETTGVNVTKDLADVEGEAPDRPVQAALVRYENGKETGRLVLRMNPGKSSNEFAARVHGIPDEELAEERPWQEVLPEMLDFMGDDTILVQNGSFDINLLKDMMREAGYDDPEIHNDIVDSLALSRYVHADLRERGVDVPERNRLSAMSEFYGVEHSDAHDALSDVEATNGVVDAVLKNGIDNDVPGVDVDADRARYEAEEADWPDALSAYQAAKADDTTDNLGQLDTSPEARELIDNPDFANSMLDLSGEAVEFEFDGRTYTASYVDGSEWYEDVPPALSIFDDSGEQVVYRELPPNTDARDFAYVDELWGDAVTSLDRGGSEGGPDVSDDIRDAMSQVGVDVPEGAGYEELVAEYAVLKKYGDADSARGAMVSKVVTDRWEGDGPLRSNSDGVHEASIVEQSSGKYTAFVQSDGVDPEIETGFGSPDAAQEWADKKLTQRRLPFIEGLDENPELFGDVGEEGADTPDVSGKVDAWDTAVGAGLLDKEWGGTFQVITDTEGKERVAYASPEGKSWAFEENDGGGWSVINVGSGEEHTFGSMTEASDFVHNSGDEGPSAPDVDVTPEGGGGSADVTPDVDVPDTGAADVPDAYEPPAGNPSSAAVLNDTYEIGNWDDGTNMVFFPNDIAPNEDGYKPAVRYNSDKGTWDAYSADGKLLKGGVEFEEAHDVIHADSDGLSTDGTSVPEQMGAWNAAGAALGDLSPESAKGWKLFTEDPPTGDMEMHETSRVVYTPESGSAYYRGRVYRHSETGEWVGEWNLKGDSTKVSPQSQRVFGSPEEAMVYVRSGVDAKVQAYVDKGEHPVGHGIGHQHTPAMQGDVIPSPGAGDSPIELLDGETGVRTAPPPDQSLGEVIGFGGVWDTGGAGTSRRAIDGVHVVTPGDTGDQLTEAAMNQKGHRPMKTAQVESTVVPTLDAFDEAGLMLPGILPTLPIVDGGKEGSFIQRIKSSGRIKNVGIASSGNGSPKSNGDAVAFLTHELGHAIEFGIGAQRRLDAGDVDGPNPILGLMGGPGDDATYKRFRKAWKAGKKNPNLSNEEWMASMVAELDDWEDGPAKDLMTAFATSPEAARIRTYTVKGTSEYLGRPTEVFARTLPYWLERRLRERGQTQRADAIRSSLEGDGFFNGWIGAGANWDFDSPALGAALDAMDGILGDAGLLTDTVPGTPGGVV